YDVEQSDPAIAVDLANHLEVPCGLLADAVAVGVDSRLSTLVADLVLCNFGSDGEAGGCNAAVSSIDGRRIGNDCPFVAVECRYSVFDSGNRVVESLTNWSRVPSGAESPLGKARIGPLEPRRDGGIRLRFRLLLA